MSSHLGIAFWPEVTQSLRVVRPYSEVFIGDEISGYTRRVVTRGQTHEFVQFESSDFSYGERFTGTHRSQVWDLQVYINSRLDKKEPWAPFWFTEPVEMTRIEKMIYTLEAGLNGSRLDFAYGVAGDGSDVFNRVSINLPFRAENVKTTQPLSVYPSPVVLDGEYRHEVTPKVSGIHTFSFRLRRVAGNYG